MTPLETPERIGRADVVAMAGLVLAATAIPLWLAAAAGAIGLPNNDDWVYMRAASTLYETGVVDMAGHTTAFIGQLFMVQPFLWLSGGEPWAFMAFGLVMTSIAVVATYLLARRYVETASAILVVLLVLAFPGFARESASFMTDVPAFAMSMVCLLLGTRWLQGDGGRLGFVASLGVGLVAVSIREFAIAAPVAILVAGWARNRAEERVWLAACTVLLAAGIVAVLALSGSASGHGSPSGIQFWGLFELAPAFATLAAVLLPALVLFVALRMRDLRPWQVIAAAFACIVAIAPDRQILGNLWTAEGLAGNELLAGARSPLFGAGAWALSSQFALFAAILAAAVALNWGRRHAARLTSVSTAAAVGLRIARSREGPLFLFLFGYAGELVLYGLVGGMFDRYLYPMVPVAAILLLRGHMRPFQAGRTQAIAHGALAWLAVSAFIITANSFAYDAARNREGEEAVAMGYDAKTVDAGYEWVGSHGGDARPVFVPTGVNWWQGIWMSFRPCAVLSNSPVELEGYRLVRVNESAYKQFLFFGPAQPLYLYGAMVEGCPAPPAVDVTQPSS